MTKMEMIVREALIDNGVMNSDWKVEIKIAYSGYQFVNLEITVYQPRHHKPSTVWEVPYDSFRNLLHWADAELVYNRYY